MHRATRCALGLSASLFLAPRAATVLGAAQCFIGSATALGAPHGFIESAAVCVEGPSIVQSTTSSLAAGRPAGDKSPDRAAPAHDTVEVCQKAQALIGAKDWAGAIEVLQDHLRRAAGDALTRELLGAALAHQGRLDEAAHYTDAAIRLYTGEGKEPAARALASNLRKLDPLSARRDLFLRKVADSLCDSAQELLEQGHTERARKLLERLPAISIGKDLERADALLAKARAATEQVDLDTATVARPENGEWPLFEIDSAHYHFACNLEPEVVKRVADVMDDIHTYYVQIYFDGDEKRTKGEKATVRIYPSWARMAEHWQGPSAPLGWWSSGTNEVVTFDTRASSGDARATSGDTRTGSGDMRASSGSLDEMLLTLFHEASHQFMTILSGGGFTPAWLNEGTASFFEGAVAMADHRVLWPDAAIGRLQTLVAQVRDEKKLDAETVVSYAEPGSYPPEYYSFGWGLVYFLQQYEDASTLEYVYRPLYSEYRKAVIQRGGEPMAVFKDVFLGKHSPLGHQEFADFERDWKKWILEEIQPLHGAPQRARELRQAHVKRYLDAADLARESKRAKVGEDELLRRALGHVEYIRTHLDKDDNPDGEMIVLQADILERLKRPAAAAPLLERALDLADQGRFKPDEKRYAELEKRLAKIDRKNAALRTARSKTRELARTATLLLEDYKKASAPLLLRSYTFAALCGAVLEDKDTLLPAASALRAQAREHGLLLGTIRELSGPGGGWKTIFNANPPRFTHAAGRILLECQRQHGFIRCDVPLSGEYEVRCRLLREGTINVGGAWGIVIAGRLQGKWTVVGLDSKDQVVVWTVSLSSKGTTSAPQRVASFAPAPALAENEVIHLRVHVFIDGRMQIRIGEREPIETTIAFDPAVVRYAGIYARNGVTVLEDAVAEQYP